MFTHMYMYIVIVYLNREWVSHREVVEAEV